MIYTPARPILLCCCFAVSLACAQTNSTPGTNPANPPAMKVQVLSLGQMQKADANLLSGYRAQVTKAAEFNGYDVTLGTWIQSQVLCPYAPDHIIIHYLKLAQGGSISLFTALIPRTKGPARIIPVLYNGGQALSVIGSTPEQRDLINQVVSTKVLADVPSADADWTTLGFCYAALGGAEPASPSPITPEETTPRLALSNEGKVEEMSFTVLGADHFYQHWRIQFDRRLQVKSIALSSRMVHAPQVLPEAQPLSNARPIPAQQP